MRNSFHGGAIGMCDMNASIWCMLSEMYEAGNSAGLILEATAAGRGIHRSQSFLYLARSA